MNLTWIATRSRRGIERVRALHRKASHGDVCVYCSSSQRLGYDATWPCDTYRATLNRKGTP